MELKNIALAFVKAKKEFAPAIKNAVNPHFRSKYADLATCIDAVNDAFLKNGIAMYQETFEDTSGVTIETVLLHESGESLRCGKLHVPAPKADPQGYGSALSYCRRYSLLAACGIAAEDDDDGNAASAPGRAPAVAPRPLPVASPAQGDIPAPKPGCITVPQGRRAIAIAKGANKTDEQIKEIIAKFGVSKLLDIRREQYEQLCADLQKQSDVGSDIIIDESEPM